MNEKKFPEPVEALVLILITFGFILIFTFVAAASSFFISPEQEITSDIKLFYIIGGIFFFLVPFIYIKQRKYDLHSLFRLKPVSGEVILLTIIIGLSMSVLGDELDRLVQSLIPIPDELAKMMESLAATTFMDWFLAILGAVVVASISEELLFRGFLQVTLERKGDPTRAVILSSISWTLIHVNFYWAIQIFIMGVIIGFIAWRTGSIIPAIILHAINNFLSLLFYNLDLQTKMDWYEMGEHVSPFVIILALMGLIFGIRRITELSRMEFSDSQNTG